MASVSDSDIIRGIEVNPAYFMGLFTYALKQGRRGGLGVRTSQVPFIVLIGSNEGLRSCDLRLIYADGKTSKVTIHNRLKLLINVGMLRMTVDKRYYLTDKGYKVYNAVMNDWNDAYARIKERMKDIVLRELRAEGKIP